ncbi:MAG: hypothetical protein ACRD2Z_06670 [Thermoanaerobaculia bacterium]
MAGVSMPTMQRYKKEYRARIPSEGKGRGQRYPREAADVVRQIKQENLKRRGGARRGATKSASAAGQTFLPLTEIARRAGVSYPTARKYAAQHASAVPSQGRGRSRRYAAAAVDVFKKIRSESRRGRKPAVARGGRKKATARRATGARTASVRDQALTRRIQQLEKAQKDISRQLQDIINVLRKPIQVTIEGR